MVTYPQWTIPESIIKKDILPGLKKDPGYLTRKGFNLVDDKGEVVDPYTIKLVEIFQRHSLENNAGKRR